MIYSGKRPSQNCPLCQVLIDEYSAAERTAISAAAELANHVMADAPVFELLRRLASECALECRLAELMLMRHREVHQKANYA